MSLRRFDESALIGRLSGLPEMARVLFALCCATRQIQAWEGYVTRYLSPDTGDPTAVVRRLWSELGGDVSDAESWRAAMNEVMALFPEESPEWEPFHVYAEHFLSSLAYTMRCFLTGDPQEGAWAARHAYEAADQAAIRDLGGPIGDAESEGAILAHPIVQRELLRQERDLEIIETRRQQAWALLKTMTYSESTLVLGEMDK